MKLYGLVLVGLVACGGGSDAAVDKCDDFVDKVCDRAVSCVGGGTHSECVGAINQQISCGSSKGVSSTYDRCMDQIRSDSCATLFPDQGNGPQLSLPADCQGVILQFDSGEDVPTSTTYGDLRSVLSE